MVRVQRGIGTEQGSCFSCVHSCTCIAFLACQRHADRDSNRIRSFHELGQDAASSQTLWAKMEVQQTII